MGMTHGLTIGSGLSRAKWRHAIASRQLLTFFVLAFVFSWYPWIIAVARGQTSGPNPLGPLIAALIVARIANGWPGVRDLLGRMVLARIGLRWYAVIFGSPMVMCAGAVAIMAAFGKIPALPETAAWRELPERFIFIRLFIGLGEEPGWRGFALPRFAEAARAGHRQPDPRAGLGALGSAANGQRISRRDYSRVPHLASRGNPGPDMAFQSH